MSRRRLANLNKCERLVCRWNYKVGTKVVNDTGESRILFFALVRDASFPEGAVDNRFEQDSTNKVPHDAFQGRFQSLQDLALVDSRGIDTFGQELGQSRGCTSGDGVV